MKVFDANSAYGYMEKLVKEIGNRESGTDAEKRAAVQIKTWFEQLGLANVRVEEFQVKTSRILKEEAWLQDGSKLKCTAVGNTLSTPAEGVEGEVVMLESTAPEALKRIKGKIAAVTIILYEKDFHKVVKAGPLAIIYTSATPLAPGIYRSVRAEYTEKMNIPAVAMSHDDVLGMLTEKKRLKLVTRVEPVTATSQNVLGEIPGRLEGECVLIGGHYDTVRKVMGAHDNAAGTAMVLELARVFAQEKPKRTLRVAAWGSEELGLRGAFHYAENPENLRDLRFYLNFDVHGILLGTMRAVVVAPEDVKSLLRFISKELGVTLEITNEFGPGGSDYMPISFYGVPSVWLTRRGGADRIMHTELEDLRWCGAEAFEPAGKLSQTLLNRLLNAEELPFEKEIPDDLAKVLEKRLADSGIKKKEQK
jgi:acetylornithine deacetylase/succinyl-diaminopimelate desuccinylase-like protein